MLLALGATACAPEKLTQAYCAMKLGEVSPSISVLIEEEPAEVFNFKTRDEISQALVNSGKVVMPGQALGATTARYEQKSTMYSESVINGPSLSCGVAKAEVLLRMPPPAIDVAQEFHPGSCRYEVVLEHEKLHVDAYSRHLQHVKDVITQAFFDRYAETPAIFAKDSSTLDAFFKTESAEWLIPLISAELAKSQIAQQAIDNPTEYHRITVACPDEPLPALNF